ncbi:hypothetical protein Glove_168g305 [Diversispora epigaea]|uniref:Uncharacterized protein n=1 Tax=Diversispora epigaea TaxID=1348612 RepID=A0A397IYF4_9GLOM|nr:hypothetical protein Glove_168g305 [Diversispora epigaea]
MNLDKEAQLETHHKEQFQLLIGHHSECRQLSTVRFFLHLSSYEYFGKSPRLKFPKFIFFLLFQCYGFCRNRRSRASG